MTENMAVVKNFHNNVGENITYFNFDKILCIEFTSGKYSNRSSRKST